MKNTKSSKESIITVDILGSYASITEVHFLDKGVRRIDCVKVSKVRKYTDVRELTSEIIREFVERIEIFKPERINGHRVQKMRIVWNCIGEFMPPQPRKDEKTA